MPNPKGLIVIEDKIALEGYSLAQEGQRISYEFDAANANKVNIEYHRLKRERKKLPEAEERFKKASAAYTEFDEKKRKPFMERTGLTLVQCYEAVTGDPWPYYKVCSSYQPITHISESRAKEAE